MDSVVHAEDSSSASANLQLTVQKMEWASTGILKVYPEEGPSFFLRPEYLAPGCAAALASGASIRLSEGDSGSLLLAGRAYLAERIALAYLDRAEQCRFQLSLKLGKKGCGQAETDMALDYLESNGSLDDSRYAEAWVRNRAIHQCEGKRKLLAGLVSRGIASRTAAAALDAYFVDEDETDLCKKSIEKLSRTGKTGDKLVASLIRKGFSMKIVVNCLKER